MPIDVIIKTLFIVLVVVAAFAPVITWVERKQSAVMQDRIGANRADINGITLLGLLHPLADVLKLITKEDFVPAGANRFLHALAPVIAAIPAIVGFAVIPYGATYQFPGYEPFTLVAADIDWGVLYIFAIGSLATYGSVLAGWASNNNWSMLGSLRASAQMISYEVTMGLSIVGVFMVFQTLKLTTMAEAQDTTFRLLGFLETFGVVHSLPGWLSWIRLPFWGVFVQPAAFFMFLTCIMAENKRPPFDMPEGESEIVAGYHMEYSGMRFGLFYMSEFIEVVVIGGLLTAIFLGGWAVPFLSKDTIIGALTPHTGAVLATVLCMVLHVVTFLLKVVIMIWLQMQIRWTLPRFRYDQVMDLCWKIILPLSLVNIFVTGAVLLLVKGNGEVSFAAVAFYVLAVLAVVSALGMVLNLRNTISGAMCLVVTMISLAAIYVVLEAYLVAVLQIMVYAGAILVLFLFVVMLLNLRSDEFTAPRGRLVKWIGVGFGVFALVSFLTLIPGSLPKVVEIPADFGSYRSVGLTLYRSYVVAFEVASFLLLSAIVGAVVLAKRRLS